MNPYSSFQVSDAKFASACVALGMGCVYDAMEHVPSGPNASQKHQQLYKTFHLSPGGEYFPKEIYAALSEGRLAKQNPAHPIFPALAAIESYELLRQRYPLELSLIPLLPEAYAAGIQRTCVLHVPRQNDGNLNALLSIIAPPPTVEMDFHFAAVAAVCGFPFRSTQPTLTGRVEVNVAPSFAFAGLDLRALCEFFVNFDSQAAQEAPPPDGRVEIAHTFPGAPPGEHAAHYAHAAVKIYQAYTGRPANKASRLLLTSAFSALVSSKMTKAEEDLAVRFIVEGGSVLA